MPIKARRFLAVGQLAAGVAHEINNLLHPIINLSRRAAARRPKQDERRRYLDVVVDAGLPAGEIVRAALSTVGRGRPDETPILLSQATQRALDSIRPMLPAPIALNAAICCGKRSRLRARPN